MAQWKELKWKINENTRKSTYFYDIAEQYGLFKKLETQGEVDLEKIDFYGGYRLPSDEFLLNSSAGKAAMDSQRKSQVRNHVDLKELLNKFVCGQICFVGPAGIGKTTLMKSIAQDALEGKYEGLKEIELVHFVQCRHYRPDDLISAGDFLFGGTGLVAKEIQMVIKFASDHPSRILFIVDSLDTLQYAADGVYKTIAIDEKAGPGATLWNFLSGKVLQGCRIITSSREHSILNYFGKVRPQMVITLLGFSKESIKQVVAGYVGEEDCVAVLQHMEEKMPDMVALCNTPVILVFTLIGLKSDSELEPTTMTRIMVIVLQSMIRSPHAMQRDILNTLFKLEHLSHIGNIERRVLFFSNDFSRVGLDPQAAADLAVMAPGGFTQKLVHGDTVLFFAHQMFQEMLGSVWIAGSDFSQLKDFVKTRVNSRPFAVIRRFLYGILLDQEVYEALSQDLLQDDGNYQAKFELVRENLRSLLQENPDDHDFLEILIAMNEAKQSVDDIIQSSIQEVSLLDLPLSPSDVFAIGSIIARKDIITNLDLCNCNLDSYSMKILASTLKGSNVKVSRMILGENTHLGVDGMSAAGQIMTQCDTRDLIFSSCNLSADEVQALASTARNDKNFAKLFLNGNENMGVDGLIAAGEIITQCNGKELDVSKCNLSSEQLEAFANATKEAKEFCGLHLSDNTHLGIQGVASAGRIMTQCDSEQLHLCVCNLSTEQLQVLADSTVNAKMLQIINLSEDRLASHDDVVALLKLISNLKQKLLLYRWKITNEDRCLIQEKLNTLNKENLRVYLGDGVVLAPQAPDTNTESSIPSSVLAQHTVPHDDMISVEVSAEIERQMKTKSTKSATIGRKGGSIRNMEWKVTFHDGVFYEDSVVETSVFNNSFGSPPGRLPIAPIFQCIAKESLKGPAYLEVQSCLVPLAEGTCVEVFRKDVEDSEWEFYKKVPISKDGKICFSTEHFTLFEIVVEYTSWIWSNIRRPFVEVALENLLYIGSIDYNIACVVCLNQTKLVEDAKTALRSSGYSPLLPVPVSTVATRGSVLKITARCIRPRNLEMILDEDEHGNDRVDRIADKESSVQEILRRSKTEHYFPIRLRDGDLRHSNHTLRIKLTINSGDQEVSHTVSKEWPIRNIVTQVHKYYGDIKGNKVVMPGGNLVDQGTNEMNVFNAQQ